jgi:osmotically-inducible protein OsmY
MNVKLSSIGILVCAVLTLQGCAPVLFAGAASGVAVASDRRTMGTVFDDQSIELKMYTNLKEYKENTASHIVTTSYNNHVLLTGQTPYPEFRRKAGEMAREIPKVINVYNEIQVEPPTNMLTRSDDSYITSKVKGSILTQTNVNPARIKVVTEKGTVYLMGLVNRDEAENTVKIARSIKGVKNVVRIFEYIQ